MFAVIHKPVDGGGIHFIRIAKPLVTESRESIGGPVVNNGLVVVLAMPQDAQ